MMVLFQGKSIKVLFDSKPLTAMNPADFQVFVENIPTVSNALEFHLTRGIRYLFVYVNVSTIPIPLCYFLELELLALTSRAIFRT